jgi:cytochrome P450
MTTTEDPQSFPFEGADRQQMSPDYRRAREAEGLARVQPPFGGPAWLATRHEDVKTVLSDPRFSRARALGEDSPRLVPFLPPPDTIMAMDPPDHTRLRRLVTQAFTMRRIEQLRPRIQEIVDGLLDDMEKQDGPADLVRSFALPVSVTVICELLGVPYADRDRFQSWVDIIMSTEHPLEVVMQANGDLMGYLGALVEQRRAEPTDDLLGVLVQARDDGDRLTEQETVGLAAAVLIAGYEVTANQIGNFGFALLTHPEELRMLREDPALTAQAVEEMLRVIPPSIGEGIPRVATEDVELGGVVVKAGEAVLPSMMAANLDATVFPDAERMNFHRAENPHLAFGHGAHRCLGAQLARLELQIVVATLVRRLPGLRLAVAPDEVPWRRNTLWSAPESLPVAW